MIPEPVQGNSGPERELISASRARADQGREQGKEGKGSTSLSPSTPTSSTSTRAVGDDMGGQTIDTPALTPRLIASWRLSIDAARIRLGEFRWPWALGIALDEVVRLRATVEAVEKIAADAEAGATGLQYPLPVPELPAPEWVARVRAALPSSVPLIEPSGDGE